MTFHAPIFRWMRYLCASEDAAQELTQETFVEALQAIARYEGRATLSTWVHRIAYYRYTHWLRDRRRDIRWRAPLDEAERCADPEGGIQLESLCLRQALAKLSEDHRDTFVLHYVQQLDVPEVAEVLGIPAGTVQSRLFHARRRLRDLLRDELCPAPSGVRSSSAEPPGGPRGKDNIQEVIVR